MITHRKKALQVLWSGGIGGTEHYIKSIVKYFDKSLYETKLCFISQKGPVFEEAKREFERTVFIGVNSRYDVVGFIKYFIFLYKERFDIIHLHTRNFLTNFITIVSPNKNIVITHHIGPGDEKIDRKARIFYKLFVWKFNKVIAISHIVKNQLVNDFGVDSRKVEVVYNGVELNKYKISVSAPDNEFDSFKDSKYIIGFIGRMIDYKRPLLFIEIAQQILKKNKNYFFIMVGDGPELQKSKEATNKFKINNYFKFLGFRMDVPRILKHFDALLFTSLVEGFGIVLIEAMVAGVPVFAINSGAVSEIVEHGRNGFVFDTDNANFIAEQMIDIMEHKKKINQIKDQALKDVNEKFDIRVSIDKISKIYEEILGRAV